MSKFSSERKEAILVKLLSPDLISIADLARKEGVSDKTLYAWRDQARKSGAFMPNKKHSTHFDRQTKLTVVLETQAMNAQELSAYCREKGLYPKQVNEWRDACLHAMENEVVDQKVVRAQVRDLQQNKKTLERELRRKDKALAEAAALLVLAKKYRPLLEDEA